MWVKQKFQIIPQIFNLSIFLRSWIGFQKTLESGYGSESLNLHIDYVQRGLGLSLREVHLDQWSLTEVLRLHLEASGAFRGHNLQNWRYQQRGGFRLSDDPGFQFCRDEPQILGALNTQSVYELRQGSVISPYRYFLL